MLKGQLLIQIEFLELELYIVVSLSIEAWGYIVKYSASWCCEDICGGGRWWWRGGEVREGVLRCLYT